MNEWKLLYPTTPHSYTSYLLSKIPQIKIYPVYQFRQTKSQNTTFLQRIELLPYSCGNACFPIDCRHAPIKFCRKGTKNPWVTSESYETVEAAITIAIKRNRLIVHITGMMYRNLQHCANREERKTEMVLLL